MTMKHLLPMLLVLGCQLPTFPSGPDRWYGVVLVHEAVADSVVLEVARAPERGLYSARLFVGDTLDLDATLAIRDRVVLTTEREHWIGNAWSPLRLDGPNGRALVLDWL